MKQTLIFILLFWTTLLQAQTKSTPWQEVDTLIAHGHFSSAYDKGEQFFKEAKRKGDGYAMLHAVYQQRVAAQAYQENFVEGAVKAYQEIIPLLQGADKAVGYMLLSTAFEDYKSRIWRSYAAVELPPLQAKDLCTTSIEELAQWSSERFDHAKRLCYEMALTESEALKRVPTADYDLLIEGDTLGLRLRPTLYDVVVHGMLDDLYTLGYNPPKALLDQRELLLGTAEEFVCLEIQDDSASFALWQLRQLQALTHHHLNTEDAAVRAHVDRRRMEALKSFARTDELLATYTHGMERIAESYEDAPHEAAMFYYLLANLYKPTIYEHSDKEDIEKELQKAAKMEHYLGLVEQLAPDSEWARLGRTLYGSVTRSYLELQDNKTILPGKASQMTITVRNAGNVAYRIVARHAGERTDNFVFREVIGRKSEGMEAKVVPVEYPNPYTYQEIALQLPPLSAGEYFLIATNNGKDSDTKRSSISAFSVSNLKLSMLRNEAEGVYIGMAIDATTGRSVKDCEMTLLETTKGQTHLIATYKPDAHGYFTIPLPTGAYRNLYVRVSDGASQATYELRYDDFSRDFQSNYSWDGGRDDAQTLFTFLPDRYTYKPGETMQFSLIAYGHSDEGSRVKEHLPVKVALLNTRREEVGSLQGTTDEWGCLNGSFTIPKDATLGLFRLQTTDNISGRTLFHEINVEAFKAPTFTATLVRPQEVLHFGDSLTLQGTATTFTGLPVDGAQVRYEVRTSSMSLFGYHSISREHIASLVADTTTTDNRGEFLIPLQLGSRDIEMDATCQYTITAYVTDANGETQTAKTHFTVGHRTKHIDFTQSTTLALHGDSIGYGLFTLNGGRLAEEVTLRLCKLKVPYSDHIRSTEESDYALWAEEQVVLTRTEQTSADRDNHFVLTEEMPCGTYRLTITYTDGGEQHSESLHFNLWAEGKHTTSSYALYQSGLKAKGRNVQTGDTATLYVGTRYKGVHLYYYIRVEDRIVDKGTLCLTDETTALRIPIREEWHSRMAVYLVAVKEGVVKTSPYFLFIENKTNQLQVHLATMRNPLQPGETEQCTLTVSDYRGRPTQAALVVSIYDAALDGYGTNYWDIALAPTKWGQQLVVSADRQYAWANNTYLSVPRSVEPRYYTLPEGLNEGNIFYSLPPPATTRGLAKNRVGFDALASESLTLDEVSQQSATLFEEEATAEPAPYLRTNLTHTALFIPALHTDEQGRATFTLTAPDLLTRWHIKGFAHTRDLKYGRVSLDFVTRKTLMVQPNVPRFLYEGDQCDFTAKVTNSSDEPIEAVVRLEIGTEEYTQTVAIEVGSSTSVSFPIVVPSGGDSLVYRITASSPRHSDGEQSTIAILPRRTLVTETMAIYTNGTEKRHFLFDALASNRSATLEHKSLTLDIVSNPIWYAIEALPPLSKETNPSSESLFHRYYAATMAQHLIERYPEVEGHTEYFRPDTLATLRTHLLRQLADRQEADGGWAWMKGFASDRYTTLLIVKGVGELEAMGALCVATDETLSALIKSAVAYLDQYYQAHYERLDRKPTALDSYALYYLYARSMFPEIPFVDMRDEAYRHYTRLLLKDKPTRGTLMQKALKMLTLDRLGESAKAMKIAEVVSQSALTTDEMGTFWRDNTRGHSWDAVPVATQALLIEAFTTLGQPALLIARMQQWLLKQKQTTQWSNSIATAQAVHALVGSSPNKGSLGEMNLPSSQPMLTSTVDIKVKNAKLNVTEENQRERTRYEVIPQASKAEILILLEGAEEAHPAWGTMTWQYYEDMDKVNASGTGFALKYTYYRVEHRDGKEVLTILDEAPRKGDRLRVRLHFSADRAMDYVELRLARPAALEPVTTRSGYAYTHGLAYYRSVANDATTYYLYHLDKGRYTLECDLWVSQSGDYACGISTLQCMYAPEFRATAASQRIEIR